MKKITLSLVLALLTLSAVATNDHNHTTHEMKHWAIGGNLGFLWTQHTGSELAISPDILYEIDHTWGVGTAVHMHFNLNHSHLHHYQVMVTPYARYTPWHFGVVAPFVDICLGLGAANDAFALSIGATPGVSFDFHPRCSMSIKCGFLGYKLIGNTSQAGLMFGTEDLSVGAHFKF